MLAAAPLLMKIDPIISYSSRSWCDQPVSHYDLVLIPVDTSYSSRAAQDAQRFDRA
jgi:BarA-like signal transduction histidine kinase